jgi:alanyl-tRNA synthetase
VKTLEKFMAQSPPDRRTSKLKKYQNEILELYDRGYRVETVQEFLKAQGVNVSVRAINKFKQNLRKTASLQTTSGEAAPKKNNPQKSAEEIKSSPNINTATKLFLNNLDKD